MLLSHRARPYARVLMIAGGLIVGFTVVSAFPATRVYLSEQFPTALRGRGHLFGESCGKIFAGGLVPFFMVPHTGSPTIFFGRMLFFAAIGAFVPIVWGKETTGQIEVIITRSGDAGAGLIHSRTSTGTLGSYASHSLVAARRG
jgi:hypothetical protein